MNFGTVDNSALHTRASLVASIIGANERNRLAQIEQDKNNTYLSDYQAKIAPYVQALQGKMHTIPEHTILDPVGGGQQGPPNQRTVPQSSEMTYPTSEEAGNTYQSLFATALQNQNNPNFQRALPSIEKGYELSGRGAVTPAEQARLNLQKEELTQKKLVDEQTNQYRLGETQRKTASDQARAKANADRVQAYTEYTSSKVGAEKATGDIFTKNEDGSLTLRKDVPPQAIEKAREFYSKAYQAAQKHYESVSTLTKFAAQDRDLTPQELDEIAQAGNEVQNWKAYVDFLNPQVGGGKTTQLSTEDQQAVDWAKANPNDPRSTKILQLHGIK